MAQPNITIRGLDIERKRLLGVIEEAKGARAQLKLLNQLIATYGGSSKDDVADVEIDEDGNQEMIFEENEWPCNVVGCERWPFKSKNGLGVHLRRVHGIYHGAA
jgi:hypothetical protein